MQNLPPDVAVAADVFRSLTAAGRTFDEPDLYADARAVLGEYLRRAAEPYREPAAVTPTVTRPR